MNYLSMHQFSQNKDSSKPFATACNCPHVVIMKIYITISKLWLAISLLFWALWWFFLKLLWNLLASLCYISFLFPAPPIYALTHLLPQYICIITAKHLKMISMRFYKTFFLQLWYLRRHCCAVNAKIICQLLPVKRNIKRQGRMSDRFCWQVWQ